MKFKLTLINPQRSEVWCPTCVAYLVQGDGTSKVCDDKDGEGLYDVTFPLSDVLRIEPLFNAQHLGCDWCSPAPRWLSERMIARLSPLRRSNLERRMFEHLLRVEDEMARCTDEASRFRWEELRDRSVHLERMAGRVAMLITNVELRERSASHG